VDLLDVWSEKIDFPNPYYKAIAGGHTVPTKENGKGGNFAKGKNPFGKMPDTLQSAPKITECAGLWAGVQCALTAGCAVLVGHTRDGGALCITVLDGDDRYRSYCSTNEEVAAAGQALMQQYA
jgi:hypothetical protein